MYRKEQPVPTTAFAGKKRSQLSARGVAGRYLAAGLVASLFAVPAAAQQAISGDVVKIGVLTDMSGAYSDFTGSGAVIAAKMAVEDFSKTGKVLGKPIEIVSADHQNKADVGAQRALSWFDRDNVDVITELVTTSVALAVMNIAEQKTR
jgi:branched-chain amino acid transport system substrate-binding protein